MPADIGPDVDSLVAAARRIAARGGHSSTNSGHILLAMLADPMTPAGGKLADSGLTEQLVRAGLRKRTPAGRSGAPTDSADLTESLARAARRAENLGRRVATWEDLLLSITDAGTEAEQIISGAKLRVTDVRDRALLTLNIPLPRQPGKAARKRPERAPVPVQASVEADPDRSRRVFVIYGRDNDALRAVQDFIRDLDLLPVEFGEVEQLSNSAAPLVPNTVTQIFPYAQAVVALLTPDEIVSLHTELRQPTDAPHDRKSGCQSRPNVFFEIGMALGVKPDQTIIVQIGEVRPFSDIVGRSVLRLDSGDAKVLQRFKQRLSRAGCPVNDHGSEWLRTDRFTSLATVKRRPDGRRGSP